MPPLQVSSKFQCLLLTNSLLDSFVDAHKRVFKNVLVSLFKTPPYQEISEEVRQNIEALVAARSFYPSMPKDALPLDWDKVDSTYIRYTAAVESAYRLFATLCDHLAVKAQGGEYPKSAYDSDLAMYQALVHEYQEIGGQLNALVKQF